MENAPVPQKKITFADLVKDYDEAMKTDQEKALLYQQPVPQWIKKSPFATKKVKTQHGVQTVEADYLPIDKVEFMLDRIFQKWRVEVLSAVPIFNAIAVTVRLHYRELDGTWTFHDGVGAQQLQVKKDTSFSDLTNLNFGAVMMALPIAKSFAIKDACDHIGPIFGRNLNRADADYAFSGSYSEPKPTQPDSDEKFNERIMIMLNDCKTRDALKKLEAQLVTNEHRTKYDELWKKLK